MDNLLRLITGVLSEIFPNVITTMLAIVSFKHSNLLTKQLTISFGKSLAFSAVNNINFKTSVFSSLLVF
jgi:hypothetical protein